MASSTTQGGGRAKKPATRKPAARRPKPAPEPVAPDQDGAVLIDRDDLGFATSYTDSRTGRKGTLKDPEGQPSLQMVGRLNRLGMLAIVEPRPGYFLDKGTVSAAMDEAGRQGFKPVPSEGAEKRGGGDDNGSSNGSTWGRNR